MPSGRRAPDFLFVPIHVLAYCTVILVYLYAREYLSSHMRNYYELVALIVLHTTSGSMHSGSLATATLDSGLWTLDADTKAADG